MEVAGGELGDDRGLKVATRVCCERSSVKHGSMRMLEVRLVVLTGRIEDFSHVHVHDGRKRIKLLSPSHMEDSFIESPHDPKGYSVK